MVLIAEGTKLMSRTPLLPTRGEVPRRKACVTEHLKGHYECQEVPFGRVYRWCPESMVVKCECGKRVSLKRTDLLSSDSSTTCECGADLRIDLQEEVAGHMLKDDEADHPWRYWHTSEHTGLPF